MKFSPADSAEARTIPRVFSDRATALDRAMVPGSCAVDKCPCWLPRSSTKQRPSLTVKRACRREMLAWLRTRSQVAARPASVAPEGVMVQSRPVAEREAITEVALHDNQYFRRIGHIRQQL